MARVSFVGAAALDAMAIATLEQAVTEIGEDLTAQCMDATPYVSGTLKGSIHPEPASAGNRIAVRVSTGGESSAYALIVHEGHRADGSYERKAGPAKYLEGPLLANEPVIVAVIKAALAGTF